MQITLLQAAELVMGESDESIPAVLVRGLDIEFGEFEGIESSGQMNASLFSLKGHMLVLPDHLFSLFIRITMPVRMTITGQN